MGAYEALFTAIMGHVNPGDEVIIIEPYFDCYEPMVRLAGGIPKFIALAPVSGLEIITRTCPTRETATNKFVLPFLPIDQDRGRNHL